MTRTRNTQGFSIIELMVTVGIFAMITSILLARNSRFDDETLLQSAAYEVALSVRQTQSFGINVRGQGGVFDKPYGVYFEKGSASYRQFLDSNDDGFFTEGEMIEEYTLGRGYTIARICAFSSITPSCETEEDAVSVLFRRPDPEAIITAQKGVVGAIGSIGIELASPREGRRFIVVRQTGQIAVTKEIEEVSPQQEIGI